MVTFPTSYSRILDKIEAISPEEYGRTRNYIDGSVTRLSPYISRGVISTKMVMEEVMKRQLPWKRVEKFIQELAWRDYWQQVWKAKGTAIDRDLNNPQQGVDNQLIPSAVVNAQTDIDVMDVAIEQLYDTGYMHNHMRMYVAAVACNFGKSHWRMPARWMYYHLLDGDWASNALSWQWVVGANSNKKYFANQANINRYFRSQQRGTFLDQNYEQLSNLDKPEFLTELTSPELVTVLPKSDRFELEADEPLMIYTYYNMDPKWEVGESAQRVLHLDPEVFSRYPVSDAGIRFILDLGENIPDVHLFTGTFEELMDLYGGTDVHFKEHPLNGHYRGVEHARDWMFDVEGYFPSFFAFWKRCMKQMKVYS